MQTSQIVLAGIAAAAIGLAAAVFAAQPSSMPLKNNTFEQLVKLSGQDRFDEQARQIEQAKKQAAAKRDAAKPATDKPATDKLGSSNNSPKGNQDMTTAAAPMRILSRLGYDITPYSPAEVEQLASKLTPEERRIVLAKGTEAAFCGTLLDNKKQGTYVSKLGGLPLFSSDSKFNSGTGWPSFFKPVSWDHIRFVRDGAHGMERIEILDAKSGAHLGHVFEDGPPPTGMRFCLNSASLDFVESGKEMPVNPVVQTKVAYFAGGCFWGVEDLFQRTPGVINAVSGYQGGTMKNPTYKAISNGDTGHAETVAIYYDPSVISYEKLLGEFFRYHNPTTLNRQGPDVGTQYRSAIFASDDEQLAAAKKFLKENATWKGKPVVTQLQTVAEAGQFYEAEFNHQDYNERTGHQCQMPE